MGTIARARNNPSRAGRGRDRQSAEPSPGTHDACDGHDRHSAKQPHGASSENPARARNPPRSLPTREHWPPLPPPVPGVTARVRNPRLEPMTRVMGTIATARNNPMGRAARTPPERGTLLGHFQLGSIGHPCPPPYRRVLLREVGSAMQTLQVGSQEALRASHQRDGSRRGQLPLWPP